MVQVLLTRLSLKPVILADSVLEKPDIPVLEVFCVLRHLIVIDIIDTLGLIEVLTE
ncbi:unnamed protein product, partial [Bubo scandiacus]